MIIYKITNKINGKSYIGQTKESLKKRWSRHCEKTSNCLALKEAIKKYGKSAFSLEELAYYKNQIDLDNAEEYFIHWFNCISPNGYNIELAPRGTGKHNEETKRKIGAAQIGPKNHAYGKPSPKKGKPSGIVAWNKGLAGTYTTSRRGQKHSKATIKKVRDAAKKQWASKENRIEMSKLISGKKYYIHPETNQRVYYSRVSRMLNG